MCRQWCVPCSVTTQRSRRSSSPSSKPMGTKMPTATQLMWRICCRSNQRLDRCTRTIRTRTIRTRTDPYPDHPYPDGPAARDHEARRAPCTIRTRTIRTRTTMYQQRQCRDLTPKISTDHKSWIDVIAFSHDGQCYRLTCATSFLALLVDALGRLTCATSFLALLAQDRPAPLQHCNSRHSLALLQHGPHRPHQAPEASEPPDPTATQLMWRICCRSNQRLQQTSNLGSM